MKKIILGMLVVALCASCASKKLSVPAKDGGYKRTELEIPCSKEGMGDSKYFRATGTATAVNQGSARMAALENANALVNRMLGGYIQGLSVDYSRNVSGEARASKVQGIIEGEFAKLVSEKLNNADITCEKGYMLQDGLFEYWISIAISKEEIVEELTSRLDDNEELEIEFNRDQFRKYAEDKMQSMQDFQNK